MFIGRKDDVFKSSDYRISPFELESALIEHPAVAEAAVVPTRTRCDWPCPRLFLCCGRAMNPAPISHASCSASSGNAWLHISAFGV